MKRKLIYVLLSFLLLACNKGKVELIDTIWISTYRSYLSDPGTIIEFKSNDTLTITRGLELNTKEKYSYRIDSLKNIIINDTVIYGRIEKKTNEILLIKKSNRVDSYIPLRNYYLKKDLNEIKEILLSNNWLWIQNTDSLRLEFKDEHWFINDSRLKIYFRINESLGWKKFDCEWWAIEKFNNSYFLVLSTYHIDHQIYQIKQITNSEIILETSWSDSINHIKFSIIPHLNSFDYGIMINQLIGNWKLIDYEYPADSSFILGLQENIMPINSKERNRPFNPRDSVPIIFYDYYLNKSINYSFSANEKVLMNSESNVLREANWKISKDGKYIHTEKGWLNSMRIISLTDSTLMIEKHEIFEYRDNNNWTEKLVREKLRKITVPNKGCS